MVPLLGGFVAGCLVLALPWPVPPGRLGALLLLAPMAVGVAALLESWLLPRGGRALLLGTVGLVLGSGWSAWHHHLALQSRVALAPGAEPVAFEARVMDPPETLPALPGQAPAIRFQARVLGGSPAAAAVRPAVTLRLTWRNAPALRQGDRWQLTATVKGPWGYANPAGFDFERWMLGKRIQGSGYVRRGTLLQAAGPSRVADVRELLNRFVTERLLSHPGILTALLTGRKDAVTADQWQLFRRTGTVHLMVVSGLHVGLAAAGGYSIGLGVARLVALAAPWLLLWVNARQIAAVAGALSCTAYLLVSGAGIPAQRAWLMALPVLVLLAWGRHVSASRLLLLAATGLLAADPLRVHLQGFWLSCGAVALLLLGFAGRYQRRSWVRELLRSQWVIGLGLAPLLLALTGAFSITAWLANLLAVPLVSFVLVPLILLGGLLALPLPGLGGMLFLLADACVTLLLGWLGWLAGNPLLHVSAAGHVLLLAQAAALILILGAPRRCWPGLCLAALLWLQPRPVALPAGQFRVLALDVGQGTAVAVDTARHRLLFDAGPAFPGGFETGSAVVVPSLVATGSRVVDALVLSHDDLDHVGGAAYVRSSLDVRALLSSFPQDGAYPCHGRAWRWDGVSFQFLRPARPPGASDNDRSCVLLVDNGDQRALLAGDIGAAVERALVRLLDGPVGVMFAPHHGSRSSSTPAMVRVARPSVLIVSAALGNRYGHPHPDVVRRYRGIGAQIHQTGRHGALLWRSDAPAVVVRWRKERGPFWRSQEERLGLPGPLSRR